MKQDFSRFDGIDDISQMQKHWLIEIENFFNTYKVLEKKEARVEAWKGSAAAKQALKKYHSFTEWCIVR